MADFLKEVELRTRERLEVQKKQMPREKLRRYERRLAGRFESALRLPGHVAVIAELKQASPSAGVIREEGDIAGRIRGYTRGGAAALSILTEEHYFRGSPHLLEAARQHTTLPLLRKDFIIDPYQFEESLSLGADAILLIVALLTGSKLKEFIEQTAELGLDALVEVHDEGEMERAMLAGARIIGINNRNLRTLKVDMDTAKRLVPVLANQGKVIVVESGIREPAQLRDCHRWGADAVLIGEALMRNADAEAAVRQFTQEVMS